MSKKILIISRKDQNNRYLEFILKPMRQIEKQDIDLLIIRTLNFSTINKIKKYIISRKYRLIILSTPSLFMLHVLFFKLIGAKKTKVIVRIGGDIYENTKSLITAKIKNKQYIKATYHLITRIIQYAVLPLCDGYILNSSYLKTKKKYYFLKKKSVYIVPNQKSLRVHQTKSGVKNQKKINILTISNLNYKEKLQGIILLLDYLKEFSSKKYLIKNKIIEFHIVGGGEYEDLLIEIIESRKFDCNNLKLFFHGYQKDIGNYYHKAHIFLYCSFMDLMPNVVLDAQSYGIPVILNNQEELTTAFGKTAAIFTDQKDFFKNLNNLFEKTESYKKYSQKGLINIKTNHSIETNAKIYERMLNELA